MILLQINIDMTPATQDKPRHGLIEMNGFASVMKPANDDERAFAQELHDRIQGVLRSMGVIYPETAKPEQAAQDQGAEAPEAAS